MPRQRMVKPDFFDSESMALCSYAARIAFIGLWVMGDDYGNQKAQIYRLRRRIFPCDTMTDDEFMAILCELEEVGCIKGYEVDGERYINVPNFSVYQSVRKPSKTNIPEPPKQTAKARYTTVIHQWRTSGAPVAHHGVTTPPVTYQCATSNPERKKEGRKDDVYQHHLSSESEDRGAVAVGTAPRPSHQCPNCGEPMEPTNSKAPGTGERIWRCPGCGEEARHG